MSGIVHSSKAVSSGERGPSGKTGPRGRTAWYWKGQWNKKVQYQVDDVVRFNNSVYISLAAHLGSQPPSDQWDLIVNDGEDGASITGLQGRQGDPGEKGSSIRGDKGDKGIPGEGFRFRGNWNFSTGYQRNDLAVLNGSVFVCLATHVNQVPQPGTFWQVFCYRGDTGLQGKEGKEGKQGLAGRDGRSFIYRSQWTSDCNYKKDDVVSLSGSSWVAVEDNVGQSPPAACWECLASVGQSGPRGLTSLSGYCLPGGVISNLAYVPKFHNRVTIGSETYEFESLTFSVTQSEVPNDIYLYVNADKVAIHVEPWNGLTIRRGPPKLESVYVGCLKDKQVWNKFNRDPQVISGDLVKVLTGEPTAVCVDGNWSVVEGYQEFPDVANGIIL